MVKKLILVFLIYSLVVSAGEAQRPGNRTGNQDKRLFGKSLNTRQTKVSEPKSVIKAKKKQEANAKKSDKEYDQYVKDSRKRSVKIQSPEVQDRMIQNRKDADKHYKVKRRKTTENSRNVGRKYK